MSEGIHNRAHRQNVIREILRDLHDGKSLEEARAKFAKTFDGVASSEIAAAEAALIAEGVPVEEVQRLCDVHAALFGDAVQEGEATAAAADSADRPGHPVHTLKCENRAIETYIDEQVRPALATLWEGNTPAAREALKTALLELTSIRLHYQRKENLFFPYMERHSITAPPKVMWGVDDEIRAGIDEAAALTAGGGDVQSVKAAVDGVIAKIREMIFKEETIMVPMALEDFTGDEWRQIAAQSGEIGYTLIDPPPAFGPADSAAPVWTPSAPAGPVTGDIELPTGALRADELAAMLNTLPVDITFVDKDDTVRYFSQGQERIFPRTKAVIGRKVVHCHPPASVHIVEGILADFKSGKKTHEDFWIPMGDRTVYIRYFAVRNDGGDYLGTLEMTQNIAPIRALTGEKRLME
ncbi:MAG: DUF438 domain-containing protein [Oscillospiraceae bacterium]|nr:DUF438 domain-containing protein [Oscillospiraceae bacterium]